MEKMVQGCASGAHFIFIDRSDSETKTKLDSLIATLGLEVKTDRDTKTNMDGDEQSSILHKFSSVVGKQPRLTWDAHWVLAVKPKKRRLRVDLT
jgi:hypothetical protein